ncbi:MAG TPA: hypothetical protein VK841_10045 [Polyangiaceae bacterium]|jgi:hypothetical protein|nr:hypothetical protein [Polyangiaceae bacterium]
MGIVVDLREAVGVGWALRLGMTEDMIQRTLDDRSRMPTTGSIVDRDAMIGELARDYPALSEMAEGIPSDFVGVVAIAGGAASLVSVPVDATEEDFDFDAQDVHRLDDALTPEQTDN